MMTYRQLDCLKAIAALQAESDHCPSVREIAKRIGAKSTANVQSLLDGLQNRGIITRVKYRSRSIQIAAGTAAAKFISSTTSGRYDVGDGP